MRNGNVFLLLLLSSLMACNKPASTGTSSTVAPSPTVAGGASTSSPDAVQLKLQEYAGSGATNCGRFDVHATAEQFKTAGDCATQASQGKKPFYVAYDMPGMSVGVAGTSEGKLFTVQTQGGAGGSALTSGACPSALRVASSGRVTCFAPGDMGSMSGSHTAGSMPPGAANPHASGANPHATPK